MKSHTIISPDDLKQFYNPDEKHYEVDGHLIVYCPSRINTSLIVKGYLNIATGGALVVGKSIKVDMFIEANGPIEAGRSIEADWYIATSGSVRAGGEIRTDGSMDVGGTIIADESIISNGFVRAGGSIEAGWDIRSGGFIEGGSFVNAGNYIFAMNDYINARYSISAGKSINIGKYIKVGEPITGLPTSTLVTPTIWVGGNINVDGPIWVGDGDINVGGYIYPSCGSITAKTISTKQIPFGRDYGRNYWAYMPPLEKWREKILDKNNGWNDLREMISPDEAKEIVKWDGWHWLLRGQLECFFGLKELFPPPQEEK